MPWIRQADRDFRPANGIEDKEPFITRIEVEDWKRPREQVESLSEVLDVHEG